ncbi:hypothetical protein LWI29_025539 [Acer saccharum]|uniref:Uncharacterized protein n=1 Tax=Acer saccharum TaxID=4024 RepID=A0AA39RIK5_ACESA|nr:hypothetical protein LWI29_025539 [Acer saccharum]
MARGSGDGSRHSSKEFSGFWRYDMDNYRQAKVQKFEEFVDRRLKPDLVSAIAERDKVFEQQKIFSDLRRNIENLEKIVLQVLELWSTSDLKCTCKLMCQIHNGYLWI